MTAVLFSVVLLALFLTTAGAVSRAAGTGPCAAHTGRHTPRAIERATRPVGRHEPAYVEEHEDDTLRQRIFPEIANGVVA